MMIKSANRLKVAIALLTFFACVISAALIFVNRPIARADDGERDIVATYILGEEVERMYGAIAVEEGDGYYTAVIGADGKYVYTYSDCATGWAMAMRESTSAETPVLVRLVKDWVAEETEDTVEEDSGYYSQEVALQTSFGDDDRAFKYGSLYIPDGNGVVLDLNGHMLDRHRARETYGETCKYGSVIYAGRNIMLEITDSDESKSAEHEIFVEKKVDYVGSEYVEEDIYITVKGGLITGGRTEAGGGVYAPDGGTIIMSDGAITGNGYSVQSSGGSAGGGVYLAGQAMSPATFIMNGGEISGNNAAFGGGVGVYDATFIMTGGTIKSNTATTRGGGVYVDVKIDTYSAFEMSGGMIEGNTATTQGGGVYLNSLASFKMTGGFIKDNLAKSVGGGVYSGNTYDIPPLNPGTLTLTGGEISGNTARQNSGGGIYINFGKLVMGGTAKISGNTAGSASYGGQGGGGVLVSQRAEFEMNGGEISGNTSINDGGGGVRVLGKLTMSGTAKISGNTATSNYGNSGGGGVSLEVGTLTMNGGEISGNVVKGNSAGGGVRVSTGGLFILNKGGKISGNTSESVGGGVFVYGAEFEMTGGAISDNTVYFVPDKEDQSNTILNKGSGGGVYIEPGEFTMSGGEISGNKTGVVMPTASDEDSENTVEVKGANGGGVCVINSSSMFTMTGGEISGNTVNGDSKGGGVYIEGNNEMFDMSGGKITGNVVVGGVKQETVNGNTVNVLYGDGGGVYVTTVLTRYDSPSAEVSMYGSAEISGNTAYNNGGGAYVANKAVLDMKGNAKISGNYTLQGDGGGAYAKDNSATIKMDGNAKISNNVVDRGDGAGVYLSYADLTMESGEISGNEAFPDYKYHDVKIPNIGNGGGVYVGAYSFFTMNGGKIDNNLASGFAGGGGYGGGVYLLGTFYFNDGEISHNEAAQMGGGINMAGSYVGGYLISASLYMEGGKISGNEASGGGGIYFGSGNFYLSGGEITKNSSWSSMNAGGGVHVSGSTNFQISGSPKIYGNTGNDGFVDGDYVEADSDVILCNTDARFSFTTYGMLSNDAYIGIRIHHLRYQDHNFIFTSSYHSRHSEIDPAMFFFSNDPNYVVKMVDGPEAKLVERVNLTVKLAYGDSTATLEEPDGYNLTYVYHYGYTVRYSVIGADDSLVVTAYKIGTETAIDKTAITNVGEYKLVFTVDDDDYGDTVSVSYRVSIIRRDLTDETLSITSPDREYDGGNAVLPELTIVYDGVTLVENTDYEVVCINNIYPGVATATVTFIGNYSGLKKIEYNITLEGGYYAVVWQHYRGKAWNNIEAATVFEFIPGERTDQSGNIRALLTAKFTGSDEKVKYAYAIGVTDYKDEIDEADLSNAKIVFVLNGATLERLINKGVYTLAFTAEKEDGLMISDPKLGITVNPFNVNDNSAEDRASMMDLRVNGANNIVYDGKEKKPPITIYFDRLLLVENRDFTVAYSDNIEAGTATVTVTFIGNYVGTTVGHFTIAKAQNGWDGQISVIRWSYGEFVADRNVFIAKTLYMSDGTNAHFSIGGVVKSADNPLTDITVTRVVDSSYGECYKVVDEKAVAALKALNAGSYTMIVWVDATASYEAIKPVEVTFDVFKSQNDWTNVPSVRAWHYSAYDSNVNAPYAEAKHGNVTLIVKNKDGEIVYDKANGLDKLGEQNVGEYTLIASVPESANFIGLNYTTTFAIAKAQNDWLEGELPRIESWVTGEYNGEKPIAQAVFGDVRVVITDKNGKVVFDSLNGTNSLANLDADTYLLTATVAESDNYYELEYSRQFTVFEKFGLPWWAVLLIALGTLGVAALVMLILHKTGVLQLFTEKMVVALRARADTDATIAAVRAGKYAAKKEKESEKQQKEEKKEEKKEMKEIKRVETLNRRTDAAVNRAADVRARAAQQRTDKTPPTDKK